MENNANIINMNLKKLIHYQIEIYFKFSQFSILPQ